MEKICYDYNRMNVGLPRDAYDVKGFASCGMQQEIPQLFFRSGTNILTCYRNPQETSYSQGFETQGFR